MGNKEKVQLSMVPPLPCPHCKDKNGDSVLLVSGLGQLHECVCPACHGRFLARDQVEDLVVEKMGVAIGLLRQLTELYPGHALTCPGCASSTNLLLLRGVYLDLCVVCGGVWFDEGELSQFTLGLVEETRAEKVKEHENLESIEAPQHWLQELRQSAGAALQEFLNILFEENQYTVDTFPLARGSTQRKMAKGSSSLYLSEHSISQADIKNALNIFSNYAEFDFAFLADNHHGILLDEIAQHDLEQVQLRLKNSGISSSIVDRQDLALPLGKKLSRGQALTHGIEFHDAFSRSFVIPWEQFALISLGDVKRIHQKDYNKNYAMVPGPSGRSRYVEVEPAYEKRSDRASHKIIRVFEYITLDGQRGYLETHQSYSDFHPLSTRDRSPPQKTDVFNDLSLACVAAKKNAPRLVLSLGLEAFARGAPQETPLFRSRRFYERSLRWLLWSAQRAKSTRTDAK